MTDDLNPGTRLVVTRGRRVPFPRGLGTVVLAIVCAVLAVSLGIVVLDASKADRERGQLACQVQRLGGQPVGGVNCPRPKTTPHASPTRTPTSMPSPARTVLVVIVPRPSAPQPTPAPQPHVTTHPTPAATHSPNPRPKPTPSPTCSPLPVVGCLP